MSPGPARLPLAVGETADAELVPVAGEYLLTADAPGRRRVWRRRLVAR